MATTYAIPDGKKHFDAVTYTANAGTQSLTTQFAVDFAWLKSRSNAYSHTVYDRNRGALQFLGTSNTAAEATSANSLTSFNSNGVTLGNNENSNLSGSSIAWLWKAGGTAVSNTAGSITSSVSANTTAGVSVCTWTGTNTNSTIGHGLGVAPAMYITKQISATGDWFVYHQSVGATKGLFLELTNVATTNTYFNNTAPTSTVFSIGSGVGGLNASGVTQVTYCFAPVVGYSAFGKYTGNSSATDGPFVYLGFRPRFIIIKTADTFAGDWHMIDTTRDTYNVTQYHLSANSSGAEYSGSNQYIDVLSNGFKLRNGTGQLNNSATTHIYMAFAENPFKYANAR